eukprot:g2002.t1
MGSGAAGGSRGASGAEARAQAAVVELEELGAEVFFGVGALDSAGGAGAVVRRLDPALDWDSLAGYEHAKRAAEDALVLALRHPHLYEDVARQTRARFESPRPRAVLLEGPPGTGKTLLARIVAARGAVPLVHVPLEAVVSKWYGSSEKRLARIFELCEQLGGGGCNDSDGGGALLFLDEVDALAGDRGGGGGDGGGMHEASRRLLSVLLAKTEDAMSGPRRTVVICATNRRSDLDAAMLSRFSMTIRFELPDERTRALVFARHARHLDPAQLAELARRSAGRSSREIKEVCEDAERRSLAARMALEEGENSGSGRLAASAAKRAS